MFGSSKKEFHWLIALARRKPSGCKKAPVTKALIVAEPYRSKFNNALLYLYIVMHCKRYLQNIVIR